MRVRSDFSVEPSRRRPALGRLAVVVAAGLMLSACSSFNLFAAKDEQPPDEPADKLYNQAVFLLNEEKNYKNAAKKFEEVDRQHPYSEWARKAPVTPEAHKALYLPDWSVFNKNLKRATDIWNRLIHK